MHAVATSPDDLFCWDCRSGRFISVCYQEKKKCLCRSSVSSKARRYPDFIRKNSPNPAEFAQFAFNLLMRPDVARGRFLAQQGQIPPRYASRDDSGKAG